MSARVTRASRRRAIVEPEEDQIANTTITVQEQEGDHAPARTRSPRKSRGRRQASSASNEPAPAARARGRPKKNAAPAEPRPSLEAHDITVQPEETPLKKTSRPRKGVARRSSVSQTEKGDSEMRTSTPQASVSPEPEPKPEPQPEREAEPAPTPATKPPSTPLADVTNVSTNKWQTLGDPIQATVRPIKPMNTVFGKPMDIVIKSRTVNVNVMESKPPAPRIVITNLILTNFKSYAGRQEVGPFHASFSSVVGPNGSGKSNVIDSLLFVFGFRASKMRQGKISALIHNSAQHPSLEYCEVAVHFQKVMDMVCSHRSFTDTLSDHYRSLAVDTM